LKCYIGHIVFGS